MIRAAMALALLSASFWAGWHESSIRRDTATTRAMLAQSEQARKLEQRNAAKTIRAIDNRILAGAVENRLALAARTDLDRLRTALDKLRSTPAGTGAVLADACIPEHARITQLADLLDQGAGLVEEGSGLVERLRADRAALIESR